MHNELEDEILDGELDFDPNKIFLQEENKTHEDDQEIIEEYFFHNYDTKERHDMKK